MAPLTSLFLLLLAHSVLSFKNYQNNIPNGDRVDHPCFPNQFWQGVGHFLKGGGKARNPFGVDFMNAGRTWTRELCMKDSDGDGRSNGDELGDPGCVWSKGKTPARVTKISHPGACQPVTSAHCKKRNGAWDLCKADKLVCPAISATDVTNITLKFTKTNIPNKVTNYYCQAFELPVDKDYHMIAHEPIIDNAEVMHHALIFGCDKAPDANLFKTPRECGMGGTSCTALIGLWGLGATGSCLPEQYGIKFGKTGYKSLVIQYHWNNVGQRSNLYDASAFRFYLTSKLRPYQGGIMMAGQRYLELPPGKTMVTQNATCTSDCTSLLKHAVNVTDIIPHMHYAGKFAEAYQYRKGKKVRDLLKYTPFVYDEPLQKRFAEPIQFLPGDEIRMKCHFKTTHLKDTMYYGDSTQDEMCFLFLRYYPATKFPACLNYGPIDMCGIYLPKNGGKYNLPGNVGKCNVADFLAVSLVKKWNPMLDEFCDYSVATCRSGCMAVLKRMMSEEPCWQGWAKKYLEFMTTYSMELGKVRLQLGQCEAKLFMEQKGTPKSPTSPPSPPSPSKGQMDQMQAILLGVGCGVVLLLVVVVAVIGILKALGSGGKQRSFLHLDEKAASGCENNAYAYDPNNTKF